jgi:hypothetical protein
LDSPEWIRSRIRRPELAREASSYTEYKALEIDADTDAQIFFKKKKKDTVEKFSAKKVT